MQALNSLRKNGTINAKTRLIPDGYRTSAQLVYTDNLYYGYRIAAPKHEWPFYARSSDEWFPTHFDIASDTVEITSIDFASGAINERVDRIVPFHLTRPANAIRISGLARLADNIELGATNSLNGDKLLGIEPLHEIGRINLRISYQMGGGLHTLHAGRT